MPILPFIRKVLLKVIRVVSILSLPETRRCQRVLLTIKCLLSLKLPDMSSLLTVRNSVITLSSAILKNVCQQMEISVRHTQLTDLSLH